MPILFCGINWHGPSCKNLAMPKDDDSIDSQSFIKKIIDIWDSIIVEAKRDSNTTNWGKVSTKVSVNKI